MTQQRDCTPNTGRAVLVVELEREYRALEHRKFWSVVMRNVKPLTTDEQTRHANLRAWLRVNPPLGWPYRCAECLLGTGCDSRICLGCRFG